MEDIKIYIKRTACAGVVCVRLFYEEVNGVCAYTKFKVQFL
jgi:hypothetical protein